MNGKLTGRKSGVVLLAAMIVAAAALRAQAMDRWEALSQIESGDNDKAVGAAGEISRYQIKPRVWRSYAHAQASWERREDAQAVAREIMQKRCAEFEASHHRPPTDREFYILWNAPAKIKRPSQAVLERAERFCNLLAPR